MSRWNDTDQSSHFAVVGNLNRCSLFSVTFLQKTLQINGCSTIIPKMTTISRYDLQVDQ